MKAEHTPAVESGANTPTVIERKRKADGTIREYRCSLVHRGRGLMVVRYVFDGPAGTFNTPIEIPRRTVSDGWFWERQPYNLYRMHGPDGRLVAHRFDAVADVRLGDGIVEYRDLVLDWWALPDGTVIEEDRDEFEDLSTRGLLSEGDIAEANRAAQAVLGRYRHIIEEVERVERRLKIAPPSLHRDRGGTILLP